MILNLEFQTKPNYQYNMGAEWKRKVNINQESFLSQILFFFRMLLENVGWQNKGIIQEIGAGWMYEQ